MNILARMNPKRPRTAAPDRNGLRVPDAPQCVSRPTLTRPTGTLSHRMGEGRGEGTLSGIRPISQPLPIRAAGSGSLGLLTQSRQQCRRSVRRKPFSERRAQRQNAFTLVELLLVLVILGTLAAIVVPKFSGRTEQARITAAITQIANFGVALDSFEVDTGYYPKGKNGLLDLVSQPRDETNWKGPYVKGEIPKDPWGNEYIYECPGKHNDKSYDLMSMGPDGRVGGDDDISNWQQPSNKR